MAEFGTFYFGFLAFVICCLVGLVMSWIGGGLIDTLHETGKDLPGSDSDFANDTQGQVYWAMNLYYFLMYVIPVIGAVIFGQSILKRVRQSRYEWR